MIDTEYPPSRVRAPATANLTAGCSAPDHQFQGTLKWRLKNLWSRAMAQWASQTTVRWSGLLGYQKKNHS
ncbi:hypothetical protein AALP_AA8G475400 [Arabis alpina]|uniref:Uncharacterized protein n=1 Tax=Arabis alpina TaxID=50452 RepID=A0A087GE20_ARAAL|nr:hypothetical protein AALP_AA8G475400 [Arabis alpina]